ncbi:MAG: family 10 glycosylhydrolase [Oligoflexia bacterium]|nr:family 10 glycosylhydrolase [Oligoflexia bacterium]
MSSQAEFGLWMEASGEGAALLSRSALERALRQCTDFGVTDLFFQVYREGKTWFNSRHADPEPFTTAASQGYSPLDLTLQYCDAHGIRVHAWINVFNLGANAKAPILQKLGAEALQLDCTGKSVEQHSCAEEHEFVLDAPKYWLDPLHTGVHDYLMAVVGELFQQFPALAGLHLDYMRYPYMLPLKPSARVSHGVDFGYQPKSLQAFALATQDSEPFLRKQGKLVPRSDDLALAWDRFRRAAVSRYLGEFRQIIGVKRDLSVAAMPWPERAFYTAFQNWRSWLSNDEVNCICLMSYTADDEHFEQLVRQAKAFESKKSKLMAGVGCYLLSEKSNLERQLKLARNLKASPIIFSYRNLAKQGWMIA